MTTLLGRLVGRRHPRLDHLRVTVYSREECCCCRKAMDILEDYRGRFGFELEKVDVDSDPALAAEHGSEVPVVAIGGKVRFRGVVNPVLLDRLLEAEGRGR